MPMLKFGRNNIAVVELDRRNLNAIETNKRVFKKRYLFGELPQGPSLLSRI